MERIVKIATSLSIALLTLGIAVGAEAQSSSMTFFISSAGSGKGADLGGLDGADKICQALAQAVGVGGRTWRAYLSTQPAGGAAAVCNGGLPGAATALRRRTVADVLALRASGSHSSTKEKMVMTPSNGLPANLTRTEKWG